MAKKKPRRQAAAPSPPSQAELETLCRLLGQQGIRPEPAQLATLDRSAITAMAAALTQLAERQRTHPDVLAVKIGLKAPPGGWSPGHLLNWLKARERGAPIDHDVTFYSDVDAPTTITRAFPSVRARARRPQAERSRPGAPRKVLTSDIEKLRKQNPRLGTRELAQRLKVSRKTIIRRLREP